VNASVRATSVNANGVLVTEVYVNGASVLNSSTPGTVNLQTMSCSISGIVFVVAGQYIELYADCSSTESVVASADATFMSIHFIGV
jgi:hypothetical protein